MIKNIKAKTHPAHYMMHKYWGRKPHNVVKVYIRTFTKQDEVVLDPFMGSGVVVIESLKQNRKVIGIDLNPVSCFITETSINAWDKEKLDRKFQEIYYKNINAFGSVYNTKCPKCKKIVEFENSVWDNDKLSRIKGTCGDCGKFVKNADSYDLTVFQKSVSLFNKLNKQKKLTYPKDKILKYVMRNKKDSVNKLFSERALIILGTLIKDIRQIKDKAVRDLLLMCFTSMLPNVSKMIPGNKDTAMGRSGWVISKLWAPKIHTEKNIFISLQHRYSKIVKGKLELNGLVNPSNATILNINAEKLLKIKSNSVDYIFTDPPYGDSIAYFGLSMFWNSWLKNDVDYPNEIIYDPYRKKLYDDYDKRMKKVFKELYRVLKNKKYLSFTFHNRNLNIWKSVMDAVKDSGFHLKSVVYQEQAVSSGTQGINHKNTLRGDFVYNLYKDTKKINHCKLPPRRDCEKMIIKKVVVLIQSSKNGASPDKLYEKLIPFIVENDAYADQDGKVINVEQLLNNNFKYAKVINNNATDYVWQISK